MESRFFGDGSLRLDWIDIQSRFGRLRPTLVLKGKVLARGYSPGAVILISAEVTAPNLAITSYSYLGSIVPVPVVLGDIPPPYLPTNPGPKDEKNVDFDTLLHLDAAMIETLEELRQGRDFDLQMDTTFLLVNRGVSDGSNKSEPLVHYKVDPVITSQERSPIPKHTWGQVLRNWERGIGIPLVVPIPELTQDPSRADIARNLRVGWQKIDGGDYPGSLAESRKSLELLRDLSPAMKHPHTFPKDRDIDQRIYFVIDALFNLASASAHADGAVKDFIPQRSDAVGVCAAAAAIAQDLFARLKDS